jgi:hypothetical protein
MKYFLLITVVAFAAPALAQDKPAAGAETSKPATQETAKPKPMARKHGPKHGEDARHCLDLPSSSEIIKCAEEYL